MFSLTVAIAELTMDAETKRITNIVFSRKDLKFKCQRCAVFCCKLGGPKLNVKDLQRLKHAGYDAEKSVKNTNEGDADKKLLKEREDGSCVFLDYSHESKKHMCVIYGFRPSLCRLYPFEFEQTSENAGILKLIPLCHGLNATDGEMVDRKFVEKNLLKAIIDSLETIGASPSR
jgi:Fe-S-cluster containining protein